MVDGGWWIVDSGHSRPFDAYISNSGTSLVVLKFVPARELLITFLMISSTLSQSSCGREVICTAKYSWICWIILWL